MGRQRKARDGSGIVEVLAELERIAGAGGRVGTGPVSTSTWRALEEAAETLDPDPDPPSWLVARPCPKGAFRWHAEALRAHITGRAEGPGARERTAYHLRWLRHLWSPNEARWQPRVSVIIPVYNRSCLVREALASVREQTHPAFEIIVVDDGSDDGLGEALRPWADRIRLLRQPNRGVASARNRGIGAARGELVHFLDSDDLLDADALRLKLAGFRAVADAGLAFSGARIEGDLERYAGQPLRYLEPPRGGSDCPTEDLLDVLLRRHPFVPSAVMVPRSVLLETGLFDERLRRGEDTEYFFRLGFRRTKVIGIALRLATRRVVANSLSWRHEEHDEERARCSGIVLLELFRHPACWIHADPIAERLFAHRRWRWFVAAGEEGLPELREALLRGVRALGEERRGDGFSPVRLLQSCLAAAQEVERQQPEIAGYAFHRRIVDALSFSLERSRALE